MSHKRGFRARRSLYLIVALVIAFAVSACVTNPGAFEVEAHPGSFLDLEDGTGAQSFVFPIGGPACDDDNDNDVDGLTDSGTDPECDSATDANERLDGVQSYVPTVLPVDIDAGGVITVDPTDLMIQPFEYCFDTGGIGVWCTKTTITGTGSPQTGSISSGTVTVPLPLSIKLEELVGFPGGLGANCTISPINSTLEGDSYNTSTGDTTIASEDISVPAATDCGDWTSATNEYLGLPTLGNSTLVATILNGSDQPVAFD